MKHSSESSQDTPFSAPPDAEVYAGAVVERVEGLIESGIWEGLEAVTLHTWLGNFRTDLERYFSACVLDALIFRSHAQTLAMMRQLLERCLVDLSRLDQLNDGLEGWRSGLSRKKKEGDPQMRLVPVVRDGDPPTKSGVIVARFYKRHLGLSESWMIWPWQIKEAVEAGVKRFVFIDDFLGTGRQFVDFAGRFSLEAQLKSAYTVYAPLVAHVSGIKKICDSLPSMRVCPVELLNERYGLFDEHSMVFDDGVNSAQSAATFYASLVEERVKPSRNYREGFGKLQLAYVFNHAVPNNCLPILWIDNDEWKPLFER